MRCETRCLKPDHAASRTKRTARSQRIKFMHRPRAHVRSKKARHGCRNSPSPQFDMCTSFITPMCSSTSICALS
eukprot:4791995-Pyramimonas_sp.AAC.1